MYILIHSSSNSWYLINKKYKINIYYLIFVIYILKGFLFTYVAPLAFVLILTMVKDGYDDYKRYKRDQEANSSLYDVIVKEKIKKVQSGNLKPG
jgi:phospholipid-translocating ATPase